jgi:hypothetical protein
MIDKKRLTYLLETLWANREMPVHELFCELLDIKLQQGKDVLVNDCTPTNFPIVQGQAKAYSELLALLRKQPAKIPAEATHGRISSNPSPYTLV